MPTRTFVLSGDHFSETAASGFSLAKYEKELNAAQLEAVRTTEGAVLVVAGAGTGKTKTLTYRVAYLIESGVPAQSILLLTFTRRAAEEMLSRAAMVAGPACAQILGGTFHSYANRLLRQHSTAIGLSEQFTILDQSDSRDVIDIVRAALGYDRKGLYKRFPKKDTLQTIISYAANRALPIEAIVETLYPQFLGVVEDIKKVAVAYRDYKHKNSLVDYDDLLTLTATLLADNPTVRRHISSTLRYIMVDEYQDTNLVQAELVKLLSEVHGNVMAVGDDAQSIYAFRGANYRNILDFPKHFPNCRIIKLEENYRSTQHILDLTNAVIAQAKEKFSKRLYTTTKPNGEYPAIVHAPDEQFQSKFVAQRILELREAGLALNQMAVLMRNSRDSFDLELELRKRNIPFVKFGGQKLTEAAHIKDFVAYLKLLYNPRDVLSWNRVLKLLKGIGPKTAQDIAEWVQSAPDPYRVDMSSVSPKYLESLRALALLLSELSQSTAPLFEKAKRIYRYYLPLMQEQYLDDYPKRQKDLENFLVILLNYTSLEALLADLALEPIDLSAIDTKTARKDESPLVLSTIHSAKGLEWTAVFLINALDGILPSYYAVSDEELDEELRLLYVALTRAKEYLYISFPILRGRQQEEYFSNPSRFLAQLPSELYERILLVSARTAPKALASPRTSTRPSTSSPPDSDAFDALF
ncbi:MAG: ATP-dependent helicase [Chloroherpetonaceae bacterium]|nr:ATP-dependent helicase [Chloroherpetonaceae bacterium]